MMGILTCKENFLIVVLRSREDRKVRKLAKKKEKQVLSFNCWLKRYKVLDVSQANLNRFDEEKSDHFLTLISNTGETTTTILRKTLRIQKL